MESLAWKDVLWCGKWSFPGGRTLKLGPNEIANAHAQGKAMLSRGLDIPWCWEHQPNTIPQPVELSATIYGDADKRAAWARNTIAPVKAFKVQERDGRPVLMAAFSTKGLESKEVQQIQKCGKVSCRVDRNFRDSRDGKVYPGFTVSHIALTPKPLEPNQGPFLMSQQSDEAYFLSDAMNDDDKKADDDMTDEDSVLDEPAVETPESEVVEEVTPAGLQGIVDTLRSVNGLAVPDEVATANDLIIALKAIGPPKSNSTPIAPGDPTSNSTSSVDNPPMLMSQAQMASTRPQIVENDRRDVTRRINRLVKEGKVSPPVARTLAVEFGSFELSYSGGDIAETGVIAKLKAYESLPAKMVMQAKADGFDMSQTRVVNPPADMAQTKQATVDAIGDEIAERAKARLAKK